MSLKTKETKWRIWFSALLSTLMFFFCIGSFWVESTYGELLLAAANQGFLNFLENKRKLFLVEVCVPTFIFMLLVVGIIIFMLKKQLKIRRHINVILILISVIFLITGSMELGAVSYVKHQIHLGQKHWYDENRVVMHALGAIDGLAYTNSKEALENSYLEGNKAFECDMVLTADGELVACHDWGTGMQKGFSEDNIPTKEEFMQVKIYDQYTPMSIDEIIEFMAEDPEVYVITDTKYAEAEYYEQQFKKIVESATEHNCEDVLKRFVIQIYHPYMYGDIENIYHFDNYIYTLYQEGYRGDIQEFEEYAKFCVLNDIDVITMYEEYYSNELLEICNRYGLQLFVHTVNDEELQKEFLEKNIGIYTDKNFNGSGGMSGGEHY